MHEMHSVKTYIQYFYILLDSRTLTDISVFLQGFTLNTQPLTEISLFQEKTPVPGRLFYPLL